jgi:hypothetical protein
MIRSSGSEGVRRSWLLATCFVLCGILALSAAPATFVQPAFADGESCNAETPCPEGYHCCGGSCCSNDYYCCTVEGEGDACKTCPCDCGCG